MRQSMQFGNRNIRSAGRGSGSVEVTLPVDLAVLEGVSCRIELRDGLMPEVVLKPDFGFALPIFETVWDRLALGLGDVGEIAGFSEADYVMGLFPKSCPAGRPGLAYSDALLMRREPKPGNMFKQDDQMRSLEAVARMIEAMATVAGRRLGLPITMAALFGNQIAYAATGAPVATIDAFARSSLADISGDVGWCGGDPLAEAPWISVQPQLQKLYDHLAAWNEDETGLRRQRDHWYRARRVETRMQLTGAGVR